MTSPKQRAESSGSARVAHPERAMRRHGLSMPCYIARFERSVNLSCISGARPERRNTVGHKRSLIAQLQARDRDRDLRLDADRLTEATDRSHAELGVVERKARTFNVEVGSGARGRVLHLDRLGLAVKREVAADH